MTITATAPTLRTLARALRQHLGAFALTTALGSLLAATAAGPALADAGASPNKAHTGTSVSMAAERHRTGWTTLPSLAGGPRQEHSTVAIGSDIYVVGGVVPDAASPVGVTTTDRVEVYDTRNRTWSKAAPLPVPMNHLNAASVGGKLYVLGGLSGGSSWDALPNSYVYNPRTNAWTALAPVPAGTWRGSAAMGVAGTTIYLAGGERVLSLTPPFLQDTVSTVTSYDVATGTWTTLPSLPQGRDHAGGALVRGTFYVIGGRDHGQENVRNTVYAFDLRTRQWDERAPMPTPRGSIAAAAVGSTIYTFGGEGNPAAGSKGIFPQVEAYDTTHDTWRRLAPMPVPRHGTSAATVGRSIYIPGGGESEGAGALAVNEVYRPRQSGFHGFRDHRSAVQ